MKFYQTFKWAISAKKSWTYVSKTQSFTSDSLCTRAEKDPSRPISLLVRSKGTAWSHDWGGPDWCQEKVLHWERGWGQAPQDSGRGTKSAGVQEVFEQCSQAYIKKKK